MKNKTNIRLGRRFIKVIGAILGLLVLFNIYYFTTLTPYEENRQFPSTTTTKATHYNTAISNAQEVLRSIGKQTDFPSFSVAVGHRGKVIWSAAAGYQDLATKKKATPKTQYRIGSTSKAVTSTGIARAVDKGLLNLDNTIGDTISNWTPKQWRFSMRQLLSHTAGIGNYSDFGIASAKYTLCNCYDFKTASEGLKVFDRYDLIFEPGTDFAYSTFDINLASVVLQQAVATPFLKYLNEEVFIPLDMQDTYGDHNKAKSDNFATFYEVDRGYYRVYRSFGLEYDINLSYKWAGGGIISTPTDMVKMGMAYLREDGFISKATKQNFWTPQKLNNGEINEQQYALGWRSFLSFKNKWILEGQTPIWMVHHGGVSKGSQNFLAIFPNYDLVIDVAINTNVEDFSDLGAYLFRIANYFIQEIERKEHTLYEEIKNTKT